MTRTVITATRFDGETLFHEFLAQTESALLEKITAWTDRNDIWKWRELNRMTLNVALFA